MSGRAWGLGCIIAGPIVGLVIGVVFFMAPAVRNHTDQIAQLRAEVAQLQRAGQQDRAGFAAERAAFAQAKAQIGGTHRNLLTCGDLIEIEQSVTYSWQSAGMSGPVTLNTQWLPAHCYNQ